MNFALFWTFSIYTDAVFHQPFASSPFFFSFHQIPLSLSFLPLTDTVSLSLPLSVSLSLLTYLFLSVSLCPSPSLTLFISLCHSLYILSLFHFIPSSLSPSSLLSPPLSFDILYISLIYDIILCCLTVLEWQDRRQEGRPCCKRPSGCCSSGCRWMAHPWIEEK